MKKRILFKCILICFIGIAATQTFAQHDSKLVDNIWEARWITHPEISGEELGVYLFKKTFVLKSLNSEFIINVSADNRYKLFVNGQAASNGPARGDLKKWRYETVNIAPFLIIGENVICAKVWNFGNLSPVAQFSAKTGLIIQGNSEHEKIINTGQDWKVMIDSAYSFYPIDHLQTYYVTGPGERFDCSFHPWQWHNADFEEVGWFAAKELEQGMSIKSIKKYGIMPTWALYPSEIPQMDSKKQYFSKIRLCEGIKDANAILFETDNLIIPANQSVTILLDQEELTNAYPRLHFSGGKESQIKITYAESLFHTVLKDGKEQITVNKGNRDAIEGKRINGNYDIIICDGGINRMFEPLWWRTFRYVQIEITTKEESLLLNQFYSLFTAYPLSELADFNSSEPLLTDIFRVGWRTQRLCAGETFFDCPYYEQLQYVGDTRIQGLVTFYVSGDTLLWRKAINDFYDSRMPFGITQSRYPSSEPQLIPTYSLVWITMLWDYMLHCSDNEFIQSMLPAVLDILQWFEERFNLNGLPGKVEGWNFVDWVEYDEWDSGVPPMDQENNSAIIGLQYVYTLQKAVELFEQFNMYELAKRWENVSEKTLKAILTLCWDNERKLIADTPEKRTFSQHANILAVLTSAWPQEMQKEIILRINKDTTIAQCSYYFKFYFTEAIKKAGLGELYLETLVPWKEMLQNGLTTFMEGPEPSRSDCHAWSASPLFHFYSFICGIEPAAPGFGKVKISPNFGKLEWIEGKIPHKYGEIILKLKKTKTGQILGNIILPEGLDGNFYWDETQIELNSGINNIDL